LPLNHKLLVLLAVALAYASNFWPNRALLGIGLKWLGYPAYEGFAGIFLPHLLLYSTLMALVSGLLWWALVRAGMLPPPRFGDPKRSLILGAAGGLLALAVSLLAVWTVLPAGTIRWIDPNGWKIAGNLFSNFFEEFIFRGFILVGLRAVAGFWPAAIISAALWALLHTQFPALLQGAIFLVGIGFAWLARSAHSLWAPYVAHEVLDILGDSLIG
jgi:membrane protease YdiL (CAAX protease family)